MFKISMKPTFIVFFCLSIVFFSCSQSQEKVSVNPKEVIDINQIVSGRKLTDHYKIDEIVKLETSEKSVLGSIVEVLFIEEKFFIRQGRKRPIKVFDKNGGFLFSLGKIGKGPGELASFDDMNYDSSSNQLWVLSNDARKVNKYSINGEYINEIYFPFFAFDFSLVGEDRIIFNLKNNFSSVSGKNNILVTDRRGQILSKLRPANTDLRLPTFNGYGFLKKNLGRIIYSQSFSDTVFEFNGNNFQPLYTVASGSENQQNLNDLISKTQGDGVTIVNEISQTGSLMSDFIESKDHLYFSYIKNKFKFPVIYDKESKELYSVKSFNKNEGGLISLFFPPKSLINDQKILSVFPLSMWKMLTQFDSTNIQYLKENYTDLYEVINETDDMNNSVLLIGSFQ